MSDEVYVVAREIKTDTARTDHIVLKGDYIYAGVYKKYINGQINNKWVNIAYSPDNPFKDCVLMVLNNPEQIRDAIGVLQAALKELENE